MVAALPALPRVIGLAGCLATVLAAGPTQAQSISTNSADFNAGYKRVAGSENHPIDVSTRDANGNRIIVDGLMLTGEDQSSFSTASGAVDAYAGVGAASGGATAIGNNLTVVTQGNYNTVIINSTQTNTGAVVATTQVKSGVGSGQ